MKTMEYVIGIDIGGTFFRIGKVSRQRELFDFFTVSSQSLLDKQRPIEDLLTYLGEYIQMGTSGTLMGIAIGVPATVSKDHKTIYSDHNLGKFGRVNIADAVESHFQVPVFLDRDANYLQLRHGKSEFAQRLYNSRFLFRNRIRKCHLHCW